MLVCKSVYKRVNLAGVAGLSARVVMADLINQKAGRHQ